MYYTYVLKSIKFNSLYIGYTNDLRRRLQEHNSGNSKYTGERENWKLVYYEAYTSEECARKRELMLKEYGSAWGHLKKRIKECLLKN